MLKLLSELYHSPFTVYMQVLETCQFSHNCLCDLQDAARLLAEFKQVGMLHAL